MFTISKQYLCTQKQIGMKRYLHSLIFLCCAVMASASTYYCSPSGNGNGNSYSTPCSFSGGLSKIRQGGDTLYLLGGQYNLGNTKLTLSGNTNRNIVIAGYPGELAILDFRQTAYGTRGLQLGSSCQYVHIKNLTLRYSGKNNLYCEGSHCTFENLDIYGSADTGCQMKNGGYNLIKNVDSHDNFDYEHKNSAGQADFGGNADGFADKQHSGAPNHYVGCRAWNNSDDGWDFFQRNTSAYQEHTILENCICYKNGPAEYNMVGHARYQTDRSWFDQISGTTVTDRYGNQVTVTMAHYPNQGNANGFKLGGDYTEHNVELYHCLAVGNNASGFDQNNNCGYMVVLNGSAYDNGKNFGFYNSVNSTNNSIRSSLLLRNCLSYKPRNSNTIGSSQTTADHNSWTMSNITVNAADFQSLDSAQVLWPRQADGSLAEITFMHLNSGSDLIDAGVDVGLNYTGSAPDLGCYETDGVLHPSLVCTSNNLQQRIIAGTSISPIVFQWGGSTTGLTCFSLPAGLRSTIDDQRRTLTIIGSLAEQGVYTFTVSTDDDAICMFATITVRPATLKRVAYVTTPGSAEDEPLLNWLNQQDTLVVMETDAMDNTVDYSDYDCIVISPKPSSTAAGLGALKGYDKPMLVLKPFLFKNTAWNWGTAANTGENSVTIVSGQQTHPIFEYLLYDQVGGNYPASQTIPLFDQVNQNGATGINGWTNVSGQTVLGKTGNNGNGYDCIVEFPEGSNCNGTILTRPLLQIGISEYSTANLSKSGQQLVSNAVYYLLGLPIPSKNVWNEQNNTSINTSEETQKAVKIIRNGQLMIIKDGRTYDIFGLLVE